MPNSNRWYELIMSFVCNVVCLSHVIISVQDAVDVHSHDVSDYMESVGFCMATIPIINHRAIIC